MKFKFIVFAIAVLVMQTFSSAFAQITEVDLDLGDRVVEPGEQFVMYLYIKSAMPAVGDPNQVTSADIKISWDETQIEYVQVELGRAIPDGWTMTSVVADVNTVEAEMSGTEPITMQAGMLKYTFKAIGSAPSDTWVIAEKALFNDGDPATTTNDGMVTIEDQPPYFLTINIDPPDGGIVTKDPDKSEYDQDELVTLAAIPNEGYRFVEWTGAVTGTNSTVTVTMSSDQTVTAHFELIPFILTINIDPPEGGSVSKDPDKLEYPPGEVVSLTAIPVNDYRFVEWTGDITGTNSIVSLTMNANKTVTAHFEAIPEMISPPVRPSGVEQLYLLQESWYETGGSTSNLGHPVSDYDFDWGDGDNSGFSSSSRPYKWNKTGTFSVRARSRCELHPNVISEWSETLDVTIIPCKLNITISPMGAGNITINPDTSAYYYNQSVTLTAIPADQRFVFDHWSGDINSTKNPETLILKGEHNVIAHFTVIGEFVSVPVTLEGPDEGFTKQNLNFVTSGSTNNLGHEIEYQFDWGDGLLSSWGGGSNSHAYSKSGSYNVRSRARCKIHTDVVSAWSITHVVKISACSLFVKINPSDSAGTVTKNPNKFEFDYGDSVRLSPMPASEYAFDHWSGDLFGNSNPAFVIMDSIKNVTAYFIKVYTPDSLTINLDKGWNMISINIVLLDPNIETVFKPVMQNLKIVEDYSGRMFTPAQGLNTIGKMNYKEGYKVFMTKADTLIIIGDFIDPTTPIIVPTKWSMISYLPTVTLSVEQALFSINNPAMILKNNDGLTCIPTYGINNIANMQPGKGYQIYLDKIDTLTYPQGGKLLANFMNPGDEDITKTSGITPPEHFKFISKTGENAIIVITNDTKPNYSDGSQLVVGDEIGVFTAAGLCCGAIVWENINAAITVWGDDSQTESIDGFHAGDALNFRVYRKKTASEHSAAVKYQENHLAIYQANGFSALTELQANVPPSAVTSENGISTPKSFNLFQNYPNPFNPDTRIDYEIPVSSQVTIKIFNILGQHVRTLVNEFKLAGNHSIAWDRTDNFGNEVPSGIYVYVMSAQDFEMMKRMIIMK